LDALGDAARATIVDGRTRRVRLIEFSRVKNWLRMRLPSGQYVCYPSPRVDRLDGTMSCMGVNPYTRQWARHKLWHGLLANNCDQSLSRDVLTHNMPTAHRSGYPVVLSVHDELITEPDDLPQYTHAGLAAIMTTRPDWADDDLILAAEEFTATRYRK